MEVWGFMEMIHSRSYTYIIKNVYSDPGEVFDHILDDEKIVSRAASVTGAYNDFIAAAQQYGNTNDWKHAQEQISGYFRDERRELKRKLYRLSLLMSTFWRVLGSMSRSLARLRLVNSTKLWKDPQRLSLLSQETKITSCHYSKHPQQVETGR